MISEFERHVLDNGAKLILVPDKSKQVVTTMVLFGVGSRYETEEEAGISHVLEHMFYKGTKNRPSSLKLAEFIDEIGGEHNAFTSKEYTGYYTKVASQHLPRSVEFLSDLLLNPLFNREELEKEKNVILQEYDMYEDLPAEVAASRFERALFGKNSLGRDVIGYKETIQKTTQDKLFEYKDAHYTGENCVILIVGNFGDLPENDLIAMIRDKFKFIKGLRLIPAKPNFESAEKIIIEKKATEQSHIVVGFRGAAFGEIDRYRLRLLSIILGGSMSSRLFTEIREKRGLAYTVRTSSNSYLDTGSFETYAGIPNEKVIEALKAILSVHQQIEAKIEDSELLKAKEIVNGRMLIAFEDTNEIASHFGLSEILYGKILTPSEIIAIYQQIEISDLINVAKQYFKNDSLTFSFVGKDLIQSTVNGILKI